MSAEEPPAAAAPTRGPRRRTAIVATGVLVLLVIAAVVAVVLFGGGKHRTPVAAPTSSSPSPSPPPSPTPSPTPTGFQPGQCYSDPSLSHSLRKAVLRDCRQPHDLQITGLVQLPAGLKGLLAVDHAASTLCKPVNQAVWNRQSASLTAHMNGGQYFPTLAEYKAGDRTAACRLERQFHASALTAPLR